MSYQPNRSAEAKLVGIIHRPPGWQQAFSKPARRALSGAVGSVGGPRGEGGTFLMPNERTRADRRAIAEGRDWPRHDSLTRERRQVTS